MENRTKIGYRYNPTTGKYVTDDGIAYGSMEQAEEHVNQVNKTIKKKSNERHQNIED